MKTKMTLLAALIGATGVAQAEDHAMAGFFAGGGLSRVQANMTVEDSDCWYNCSAYTQAADDFAVSLQGGYNWVQDNFLMGVSLNYTTGGADEEFDYGYYNGPNDEMQVTSELNSLMSLRFRAGLALDKTAIVFSTGPAQGDFDGKLHDRNNNSATNQDAAEQSGTIDGWVSGISIEHAFADSIIGGIGYSSYSFDDETENMVDLFSGVDSGSKVKFVNSADTIDLFVNYQF